MRLETTAVGCVMHFSSDRQFRAQVVLHTHLTNSMTFWYGTARFDCGPILLPTKVIGSRVFFDDDRTGMISFLDTGRLVHGGEEASFIGLSQLESVLPDLRIPSPHFQVAAEASRVSLDLAETV